MPVTTRMHAPMRGCIYGRRSPPRSKRRSIFGASDAPAGAGDYLCGSETAMRVRAPARPPALSRAPFASALAQRALYAQGILRFNNN